MMVWGQLLPGLSEPPSCHCVMVPVSRGCGTAELQLPQQVALGSHVEQLLCAGSGPCRAGAEANPLLLQLPS